MHMKQPVGRPVKVQLKTVLPHTDLPPPPPPDPGDTNDILTEPGFLVLQESGGKILLEDNEND